EVVVMDWGIAKPMAAARLAAATKRDAVTMGDPQRVPHTPPVDAGDGAPPVDAGEPSSAPPARAVATRVGAYVGTPAYMSPEHAPGKTDELAARSDLYSLAVVLHELVTLRHYLGDQPSVDATLTAVVSFEPSRRTLFSERHPHAKPIPLELR